MTSAGHNRARAPSGAPSQPLDWQWLMQFGFGVLKLSAEEFWSLTPRELAAALAVYAEPPGQSLQRKDLDALMCAYPDRPIARKPSTSVAPASFLRS